MLPMVSERNPTSSSFANAVLLENLDDEYGTIVTVTEIIQFSGVERGIFTYRDKFFVPSGLI